MSRPVRLVIFDVDGTLIDSQDHIVQSMIRAFEAEGIAPPTRAQIKGIVGLSLPLAMTALVPDLAENRRQAMVAGYKTAFADLRATGQGQSPLYPGAADVLARLSQQDHTLLGIATGKSRRGLNHVLDLHAFDGLFQTLHCADDHPSKPHPAMVEACLADTGVDLRDAVLVGDTTYDMEMARAAGIGAIGVDWGYHPAQALKVAGAHCVIDTFAQLEDAIATVGASA